MTDSTDNMTDATDINQGSLTLTLPDGSQYSVTLTKPVDPQDAGRMLWVLNTAIVDLARQVTNAPEGTLDMSHVVRALIQAEWTQRALTGAYRGMFEEAQRLVQDLGGKLDNAVINKVAAQRKKAEADIGALYKRYHDLMNYPDGKV